MPIQISISNAIKGEPSSGGGSSFLNEYSFEFDGNTDYIEVADSDNLSFGNGTTDSPFSISAWIKLDTTGTTFDILFKYNAYPNGEYRFLKLSDDRLLIRLISNNNELNRIGRTTNSIASYVGQWIHVVATYNGNSANNGLKIYINSVQSDVANNSKNTYVAMSNTTYPVKIGNLSDGNIDEVAIFDVELSASDVTAIYNSGVPNDLNDLSTPPLSWWRMGEAANYAGGTWTLTDQGSGGNDGTSTTLPAPPAQPSTDIPT